MFSDTLATSLAPLPSTLGAKAVEAHNIPAWLIFKLIFRLISQRATNPLRSY